MGSRLLRIVAVSAAVVVVLGLVLAAILHLPAVRSRALAWVIAQLESRYELRLAADRLSYNLLTGGVTLTNVRLAARDFPDQPFLTASRVHADVPLAAYAGRLILDDVAVDGGTLTILTDAHGRTNLPTRGSAPPPAEPRALALRGLHLRDFTFLYDDRQAPLRISAAGVESALDDRAAGILNGAKGPFGIRGGVDVKWGERGLRVEPFESNLTFDGRNVSLEDLRLVTTMGRVSVSGTLNRVLDALSLEVGFDGEVDVARAVEWAPPPVPLAGMTHVRGTMSGPPSALEIVTRFDARALTVGTEPELTASGEILIDRTRLVANRLIASPQSGGEINAALDLPFGDAPLSLTATWQGVDARALMRAANLEVQPIGTRLDGEARFTNGPGRTLTLKTDLTAIQERGATPLAGETSASLKGDDWSVTHDLRADGVRVTGRAEGRLDAEIAGNSTIAGPSTILIESLAAADRTLEPLGIRVPEAIRDSGGAIEAEATVNGTFSNPRTTVVARAPAFEIPSVGATAIDATLEVDRRAVLIPSLRAVRDGTEATGNVSIDLTSQHLGGSIHVDVPDARTLQGTVPEQWQVSGAITSDITLEGTLEAPVIRSSLSSPVLEFAGDTYTDLEGGIDFSDRIFSTRSIHVAKDGGQLMVGGRVGLDRSYQVEVRATNLVWSRVIIGDAPSLFGVDGTFAGEGTLDRPGGDGKFGFQLKRGDASNEPTVEGIVAVALAGDLARLSLTADLPRLAVADSTAPLSAEGTVSLSTPYDYRATAVINKLDIAELAPLFEFDPVQLTGSLIATAEAAGAIEGDTPPTVQANVQQIDAKVAGVPFTLLAPAAVGWQPGELTVRNFTASLGTGTLTAEGAWGEQAKTVFSSSYRGDIVELATASRAFGVDEELVARGWMEAQVYATSNRQDLIASVAISDGRFQAAEGLVFSNLNTVASLRGEKLTLDSLTGRMEADKAGGTFAGKGEATIPELDPMRAVGRFTLDSATFDSAGIEVKQTRPTTISVDRGLVTMDDVVWEAAGSQLALGGSVDVSGSSPALNLSIQGVAVLRVLSAFVPRLGVDGTADVDVRIGGTPSNPDLAGGITLDDAEIALASPRIVISDLSGPIVLSGNRIELRALNGSANGGALTIDGGFQLRGAAIGDGEVYVQAAGMAVEYPTGLRSEVDALLVYDVEGPAPVLSGDVRVQRAAYTQPISLAALARGGNGAAVRTLNQESALEQLRLNINVTTVDDIRVDNNYGRFEGSAQLRIVGTAAQPGMSGQVTLREGGQIYAVGRTFRLERGTVSFTDLNRIRPDLDIQAITRVSNLGDVTMTLQGTPDRFEFDLTSEQDASREEIAQRLLGGGATGVNALALLSSDLLGSTGRQLGLDALRIEQGEVVRDEFREDPSAIAQDDANPVTRLTMSKRLRDNVEFTLSQNLAENGKTTFLVSYYPLTNLELRAISRDDGTQGVGVRHQVTFGGDPAARAAPVREELQVAEVRPEGNLAPFTEAEIREELKVKPGDTLNFYEWQQDLDNLTARYVERGHYEVRVRGRRDPAKEGAVNVIYAINAGPATRIQVDGFEVSKEDLEAIQQSWSRGVFDRFIVQDAEARVKQRLLLRGYVNGVVTGTMESSGAAKTLHLTVIPGSPAGSRGMSFTGNAGVSRNELEAVVQQTGMDVRGWIDRGGLEQTFTTYYRNEGYLSAKVTVQEPVVENDRGVLPVSIEEGPRSTIREIHWSGLSDAHAAGVQKVAGLSSGTPYTLAALDGARDRIDRYYRTLGHNAVQVNATGVPVDKGPPVDVNMAVVEGPQQVLQEVETVGATRTREGVVSRALRLPVGRPVNLEEWALARKRLFDTNVFRSVDIQAVPLGDAVEGVQQVRALVTVEEYPPWRFRYGFQADRNRDDSSVEGLEDAPPELTYGGIAEIRNQNLFGRAVTGGLATRVELDFQRVNTFIQTASFFGLPLRSGLFIYGSRERVRQDGAPLFIEEIQGTSFEQRWRRRRGFEITYGYRFERTHLYDPEPLPEDPFPFDQVLNDGRVTGAFLLDRRDEPVSPTKGTFSAVSVERAASWLASDTSYTRVLVQQTGFWKRGPVVLAGRVMTGRITGSDIPIDQRFLAGGATTVRGYGENALGPRDIFGVAPGGTELLILNQEVRFPLIRWFRGVGFLDVGNTFDSNYPFEWREMKVGYGLGLRLDSPIGLLRLDFGVPGSTISTSGRRANDFGSARWYFGIGHIF